MRQRCLKSIRILIAALAPAVLFAPVARSAPSSTQASDASSMAALGLARMSEQTPQKVRNGDGSTSVRLTLDGTSAELVLTPYSLRRPTCDAVLEGPNGTRTKIALPPSTTYRGIVRGGAKGVVAASIDGDAVRARILLDDGSDWYVQPIPGGLAGAHAVYRNTDVNQTPGACAAGDPPPTTSREPLAAPEAQSSGCVEADIGIEAEYAYYAWNGSSSSQTISDIDAIMNSVELIYARDVKVSFRITTYLIQTTSGKYPSSDPNTKLQQFQSWWNANQGSVQRDLAHLMTGPMTGGLLGVAYYSVICQTSQAYGVGHSYWTSNWANRVGVTAHEIGHNFGATHCNGLSDCALMCTNIGGCTNDATKFSMSSIHEIETFRNLSTCLATGTGTPTALNPTIRDDHSVTLRGAATTINVLANDFDPNCQTISVGSFSSSTPNGGTVSASGDNLVYAPASTFLGTDTFTYTVRDQGGASSSTGTVTVDVQDYAPADVATGAVSGLQVRYYYVPPLDGSLGSMPTMTTPYKIETVPTLYFPTTDGAVGESGLKDRVAARCTGIVNITSAATYTFYLTASDGAKLYIDNVLRVDNDGLHGIQERSGSVSLSAGMHDVRVDYYEETGTAGLRLEIAGGSLSRGDIPASMWASPGVQVAYYQLDSKIVPPLAAMVPEKTQAITTINYPFSWGNFGGSGRATDVGATFEGFITVPSDNVYFFEITSEDGSKFLIDDRLVVDNDGYHNRVAATGGCALKAGPHKFRLDYFARDGGNALTIQVWASGLAKQVVPSSWWSHLTTFHVPTDYSTISAGIAAATAGSKVWVAAGTYTGTGNKNLDLGGKNISVVGGGGASLTVIDLQNSGRAFNLVNHSQTNASIEGFSIVHANNTAGGVGGAMLFQNSTLNVRYCYIEGNSNPGNGGAIGLTGTSNPLFDDCLITGNHAGGSGGAIHAEGGARPTFAGCTVSGNSAASVGGGAHAMSGASISFDRTILWGNSATTNGPEAWIADATSAVDFDCSDVRVGGVGGIGLPVYGANNLISDPQFCAPASGTQAPTTAGGYRVVGNSPVLSAVTLCGEQIGARGQGCTSAVTAVEAVPGVSMVRLEQNVPNPFNPTTKITFTLPRGERATLRVYDVAGRLVRTLLDGDVPAGRQTVTWRGDDDRSLPVATGVYFYQLRSGSGVLTRSMVLLK